MYSLKSNAINNAYGSAYQGTRNFTFPVAFIEQPVGTCSNFKYSTGASWGTIDTISTTNIQVRGIDFYKRDGGENCRISYIAIGKWK